MSYKIICPYCFKEMEDREVCFRSERVSKPADNPLPIKYADDFERFKDDYEGDDKGRILNDYAVWSFFQEQDDDVFTDWWRDFGGTSESDPADEILGVKAYRRKVVDPGNPEHQGFIKVQQDGDFFIRENGMVIAIELISGELCTRRVCRFCHNPLPGDYGRHPVKFVTVIGVSGAGKTVYLSQLLRGMKDYAAKVGLTTFDDVSVGQFRQRNRIDAGVELPSATPVHYLQQPLSYRIIKNDGGGRNINDTFVMYDVAGEVVTNPALISSFAPFIRNSDALIILLDPMQFGVVMDAGGAGEKKDDPITVLNTIHSHILDMEENEKNNKPIALCISKVDTPIISELIGSDVSGRLMQEITGIKGADGFSQTTFDAKSHYPIGEGLNQYFMDHAPGLALAMRNAYTTYSWFACSSLGCSVETKTHENGTTFEAPVGPIKPRHIEEPILWMFHVLGYIGANTDYYTPGERCPKCRRTDVMSFDETIVVRKEGLFGKIGRIEETINRRCNACKHEWYVRADSGGSQ